MNEIPTGLIGRTGSPDHHAAKPKYLGTETAGGASASGGGTFSSKEKVTAHTHSLDTLAR
jgi:hypothetical protein